MRRPTTKTALAFLLVAEFRIVVELRGLSTREYFATLDPVAGTVCYLSLGAFAIMPVSMRSLARAKFLVDTAFKSDFLFWAAVRLARPWMIESILATPAGGHVAVGQ